MKKRQWIAAVVFVVACSGTAWGQEKTLFDQRCPQGTVAVPYTPMEWSELTGAERISACDKGRLVPTALAVVVPPLPDVEPIRRSRGLTIGGLVVALVGTAMIMPQGETYHVLGDSYCVNKTSVDYGSCGFSPNIKLIGLGLLGGGITMMVVGMQEVKVSPVVAPGVKGVSGTIRWGGARGKR